MTGFIILIVLINVFSIIQSYQTSKIKKYLKEIEKEMEFECKHIEDKELRDRILNIFKIMYNKRFK